MGELECQGVGVAYSERAVLSDLDLIVPQGTLTAVLGASGSGKTTLLRAIIGFMRLASGRIRIGSVVVSSAGERLHLTPERRAVGYVAQEGALYPHLSVRENVGFGLPRRERRARRRVDEVLSLVGLGASYATRGPHELSGGEQRRVALARALAPGPPLVLLDEPFSGLDAALRAETREAVLAALAAARTTAVLVTHDQAEAMSTGREVGILRSGRLVQVGTPEAVYRTPADLGVARFTGEAVVLPARAARGALECALGALALTDPRIEGPVQAMIRPEQIAVAPSRIGGTRIRGIGARVAARTFYGSDVLLRLALDGGDLTVSARAFGHLAPAVGELVEVTVSGPVVAYPAPTPRESCRPVAVAG